MLCICASSSRRGGYGATGGTSRGHGDVTFITCPASGASVTNSRVMCAFASFALPASRARSTLLNSTRQVFLPAIASARNGTLSVPSRSATTFTPAGS
jgi:hypothetical protein